MVVLDFWMNNMRNHVLKLNLALLRSVYNVHICTFYIAYDVRTNIA